MCLDTLFDGLAGQRLTDMFWYAFHHYRKIGKGKAFLGWFHGLDSSDPATARKLCAAGRRMLG